MTKRWLGDHNFVNYSDEMVLLMMEPGEIIEFDGARVVPLVGTKNSL